VFVRPSEQSPTAAAPVQETSVTAARAAAANPRTGIALAVLPFANESDDKQQEYFSNGITEEITSVLAKIPDLSVVARTSAFQFKGQNRDVQAIGQQLHATHLIEGSVRKAGDRLRITAQLVNTGNGVTIWTDSYDRQLTDVFAIQEDIAHAVATSLHMTLGLKPGEQLINQRPSDPALHDEYLRAKNLVRTRQPRSTAEAIKLLNDVVARDAGYAPAWAALAFAYQGALLTNFQIVTGSVEQARPAIDDLQQKIEAAARQAVKLDPNNATAYCALAIIQFNRNRNFAAAWELRQRGLAIDPDDPECLHGTIQLAAVGFPKQALPYRDHLLAVEPFVPVYRAVTARILFAAGETDAAIAMAKEIKGGGSIILLAQIYASQGRYHEAADTLATVNLQDPAFSKTLNTAIRLLNAAPEAAPPNDRPELGILNWVYLYTGAPERFMNTYENELRMDFLSGTPDGPQWAPAYREIRKTERFKKWVRDAGILNYWRAKGWPAQCHPTTGDDFECS
jgi:TolB-like protein